MIPNSSFVRFTTSMMIHGFTSKDGRIEVLGSQFCAGANRLHAQKLLRETGWTEFQGRHHDFYKEFKE